jgi:hypothetical protein
MRYASYFLVALIAFVGGYQWAQYGSQPASSADPAAAQAAQTPNVIGPRPALNGDQGEPSSLPIQTAQRSPSPPLAQKVTPNEITGAPSEKASASPSALKPPLPAANDPPQSNEQPPRPAAEVLAEMVTDDGSTAFPNPSAEPHQTLTSQSPDPDWSERAAQQLRDYLTSQLGTRFEYPLIECGQNICEIQAASLRGGSLEDDERDFQTVFYQMHAQPWWDQLQFDETTLRVQSKPKRAFFVCFITRK